MSPCPAIPSDPSAAPVDVVKLFLEDPAALGRALPALPVAVPEATLPEAEALGAFLDGLRQDGPDAARAYLAGTVLDAAGAAVRVGLTALAHADAWLGPLHTWAAGRAWTRLTTGGRASGVLAAEADAALRDPSAGTLALALGPGPIPADILATVVLGDDADRADALGTLVRSDAAVAVLRPHPAHDGHDWEIVARRGLGDALRAAFGVHPAPEGVRRILLPRVRSEHRFYVEQWALDDLPAGAEAL